MKDFQVVCKKRAINGRKMVIYGVWFDFNETDVIYCFELHCFSKMILCPDMRCETVRINMLLFDKMSTKNVQILKCK